MLNYCLVNIHNLFVQCAKYMSCIYNVYYLTDVCVAREDQERLAKQAEQRRKENSEQADEIIVVSQFNMITVEHA